MIRRALFLALCLLLTGLAACETTQQADPTPKYPPTTTMEEETGDMFLKSGQAEEALKQYDLAKAAGATEISIAFRKGWAMITQKEWQKALDWFAIVLSKDPLMTLALEGAGIVSLELGHLKEAYQFFQRAVDTNPAYWAPHAYLAPIYEAMGQPNMALEERRKAGTLAGDAPIVQFTLMNAQTKVQNCLAVAKEGNGETGTETETEPEHVDVPRYTPQSHKMEDTPQTKLMQVKNTLEVKKARSKDSETVKTLQAGEKVRIGLPQDDWYAVFPLEAGLFAEAGEAIGYAPAGQFSSDAPKMNDTGPAPEARPENTEAKPEKAEAKPEPPQAKPEQAETKPEQPAPPAENAAPANPAPAPAATAAPKGYSLMVSSWNEMSLAEQNVAELAAKGITAEILTTDLGAKGIWHRILIGPYSTLDEAKAEKKTLHEKHGIPEIIILRNGKFFQGN